MVSLCDEERTDLNDAKKLEKKESKVTIKFSLHIKTLHRTEIDSFWKALIWANPGYDT